MWLSSSRLWIVYGHLFEGHADEVLDRLDQHARDAATANRLQTAGGEVVELNDDSP